MEVVRGREELAIWDIWAIQLVFLERRNADARVVNITGPGWSEVGGRDDGVTSCVPMGDLALVLDHIGILIWQLRSEFKRGKRAIWHSEGRGRVRHGRREPDSKEVASFERYAFTRWVGRPTFGVSQALGAQRPRVWLG